MTTYEEAIRAEEEAETEAERRRADARAKREAFLEELLGPKGMARSAPAPLEDFEQPLREHGAQIVKAVRHLMDDVLYDDYSFDHRRLAIASLTNLVRANILLAKTLAPHESTKTVRGVPTGQEPQD